MQTNRKEELQDKMESGFFGFWIRKYRISYLIVISLIILGLVSVINIPKESSPAINLGMISISTSYPGASPQDMDGLVTDKIYKEIKDIDGIDTIDSTSGKGFSSILLTLKTSANDRDVVNDVRNAVSRITLPSDANTPVITSIETSNTMVFTIQLYADDPSISQAQLFDKAHSVKNQLEKLSVVKDVQLGEMSEYWSITIDDSAYEVQIIIPENALQSRGLTLSQIASTIQSLNSDFPIGNFTVDGRSYDYRIEGKKLTSFDFLDTPLTLPSGGTIRLGDIATIERKYLKESKSQLYIGQDQKSYTGVSITVNKNDSVSIFQGSNASKAELEKIFATPEFAGYHYAYTLDLAGVIIDDYNTLFHEAFVTIALVFITMIIFVGFADSLFAIVTLPLAYLATFILLDTGGYTMNFLTNFSLILSFGIAIDTIIVIVQAASTKIRTGYDPRAAILLALREYSSPLSAGVICTIVVFLPLVFLPGIMGKFMAYIPVTIVGVLASGLILVLTVNTALYLLAVRKKKSYIHIGDATEYATAEEKELLSLQRADKILVSQEKAPLRNRVIHATVEWYKRVLGKFLRNTRLRRISIFLPVVIFVVSIVVFPSLIGATLFPSDDNDSITLSIKGPVGTSTESMSKDMGDLTGLFSDMPEIKHSALSINGNATTITIELYKKAERDKLGQRSVFELDPILVERLSPYKERGFTVESKVASNGPPSSGGAVGINLVADNQELLPELIRVSKEFQTALENIPGTRNIKSSSEDTPGQFIFSLKSDRLATYGIPANLIYNTINQYVHGVKVGTITDKGADRDIVIKSSPDETMITTDMILALPVTVGQTNYQLRDFMEVKASNSIEQVVRKDGKIQINVSADLEPGANSITVNTALNQYTQNYQFPEGISSSSGGEAADNADFLVALLISFFLAVIIIFGILVYQFDSFSQPLIIYYSVLMATPFVLFGLWLTGNSLSVTMAIGFISFTGIAVNHGIILIDAIHLNIKKGMDAFTALVEAGSSRLEPMTLTTLLTVVGILPIALRDNFWGSMGFTIIFGIVGASFLTLFVVKGIYYELYLRDGKKPKWGARRWFPWNWSIWKRRKKKSVTREGTATEKSEETSRPQSPQEAQ